MPATDKYWRDVKRVHVIFALSSVAMFGTTIWMMAADHSNEWTGYQRTWENIEAETIRKSQREIRGSDHFQQTESDLNQQLKAAKERLGENRTELQQIGEELKAVALATDLAERAVRTQRAVRDKARADYDLSVRDARPPDVLAEFKAEFDAQQEKVDQLELEVQQKTAALNETQRRMGELTEQYDDIQAELARLNGDLDLLKSSLAKLKPDTAFLRAKRKMMEWPIINGFNSHLKINQDWLPDLKIKLGMTETARFDRCRTCHLAIERIEFAATGVLPAFPHGNPESDSFVDWVRQREFPHPFSTHPRPELYLSASSPHPVPKFGCTICHEGQGSGTGFSTAAHYPNDPPQQHEWEEEYDFAKNHFWEYPMYPKRLQEASCIKCHHSVVELGINPKFGASAPKVYRGWQLMRKYGCNGCHEIHGYEAGRPIGPDLRLEPATPEEAARYAGDPALIAGQLRKVGPSLEHVKSKTTPAWIEHWTEEPKRFRPTTRMPQFFKLTNQQDPHAERLQPVEIASIAAYLTSKSEPVELLQPEPGYRPHAQRGRELFSQRGCLACHSMDAFPKIKADFGPDLSKVHAKIRPGREGFLWLYTWIRDPVRHHKRTRMPNLYLEAYEESGTRIDPAADIAAFLLQKGPVDYPPLTWETYLGVQTDKSFDEQAARHLGLDGLRGARVVAVMSTSPAVRAIRTVTTSKDPQEVEDRIRVDDVLLKYGEVDIRDHEHLDELVAETPPGTSVPLLVWRNRSEVELTITADEPLNDLVRLHLSKVLRNEQIEQMLADRKYPLGRGSIKGDEIELFPPSGDGPVSEDEWEQIKLNYVGRRTISRYGCFGCHDIPGFETARPIGTTLQDWGRKETSMLAFEHIEEYLHQHGEPDGSSTHHRVVEATRKALAGGVEAGEFADHEEQDRENRAAYFYESLLHHGRPGFIWQKLREPRSYDYKKTETKSYEERLRMPRFRITEEEIEAIATFVLGLVAEPPSDEYLYQPEGPAKSRIEGERLLETFNCGGCHMLELPEIRYGAEIEQLTATPVTAGDHPEGLELLMKLNPPHRGLTGEQAEFQVGGESRKLPIVHFRGLPYARPDPQDPPEFQEYAYDLWQTLDVAGKRLLPGARMLVPKAMLVEEKPARGGTFAEWLVEELMESKTQGNRALAWQMAPPPLYLEGVKVQTPWLYRFLREPERLRRVTVLRMPRFNISAEEAQALADYFAAVDGAAYPYQEIPQREPDYLAAMNEQLQGRLSSQNAHYLSDCWKLLNAPLCIKCHSLGGRQFQVSDPKTDIRGPDLDHVPRRLRPEWTLLWLYKPQWITPYTSMPQPLSRDKQQFVELFGGDAGLQTIALRDALMNYFRLIESEGKTIYEPQTAETAAAGGE